MDRGALGQAIFRISHVTGTFTLRSGKTSDHYFDKYMFESNPALLVAIAEQLSVFIPPDTEVLAGLEMGGIPVATALSLKTGIPAAFVRKQAKEYGTCKLAEGFDIRGKRVCVVEDVVTTGGQIILSTNELRNLGADVADVLCVIEREEAGRTNLLDNSLNLTSLFTMEELIEFASN